MQRKTTIQREDQKDEKERKKERKIQDRYAKESGINNLEISEMSSILERDEDSNNG